MADKITQTNVIQITVRDTENNRRSFNIENPRTDTTIAQIRDIFAPIINSGKWYSTNGNPINYIEQATLTKTKKIELSGDMAPITVTPNEITNSGTTEITITGSPIKGYRVTETEGGAQFQSVNINYLANTLTVTATAGSGTPTENSYITIILINHEIKIYANINN